jgi:SAM-dependent methyltransferase
VHRPAFDRSALPYWEARSRNWRVAPPISPLPDDIRFYEANAAHFAGEAAPPRALLLGVTPAIASMRWPAGTQLVALDWAEGMLQGVLPHDHVPTHAQSLRGDWREMPLADESIDFVVGDGCYSTFQSLEGPAQLNREVARVMRRGGRFCLRCHRRADRVTPLAELFDEFFTGAIRDLDMFRWQLAMSVHGDSPDGVCLGDVWRVWNERVPDPRSLQARLGWSESALANMQGWKDSRSRYLFPTLSGLEALARETFELDDCDIPEYEWGENFPRLTMMRREA